MSHNATPTLTYDVIGDVHGQIFKLRRLLKKLGYKETKGVWEQPGHMAIFVGDLIDKGPRPSDVLETVKAMADNGYARMVIGNHELNWIQSSADHVNDHEKFLHSTNKHYCRRRMVRQFKRDPQALIDLFLWLRKQPLFIDDDIRVVHACWHQESIDLLRQANITTMDDAGLAAYRSMYSENYLALDRIISGCVHEFPEHRRKAKFKSIRTRRQWWPERTISIHPKEGKLAKVNQPLPDLDEPPVFFGHYTLVGKLMLAAENLICVDYSAAYDGPLVAYRYVPGEPLSEENFICH